MSLLHNPPGINLATLCHLISDVKINPEKPISVKRRYEYGCASKYLSHIHICQAKARWFYILYSDLQVVFGEMVVGGGIWREMQTSDNLDFKPETYL